MWLLTYIVWLVAALYLTASCLIGMVSLMFLRTNPEDFDEFRSNNPWKRLETVASVMILGPLMIPIALYENRTRD
jgi:hypothetical protein